MKGIIWISNGFRDPKKHRFVSDSTREYNLAFIVILETGRSNFLDLFIKNLCAQKITCGIAKHPRPFRWHSCGCRLRRF
jgi:hypothetical protein